MLNTVLGSLRLLGGERDDGEGLLSPAGLGSGHLVHLLRDRDVSFLVSATLCDTTLLNMLVPEFLLLPGDFSPFSS